MAEIVYVERWQYDQKTGGQKLVKVPALVSNNLSDSGIVNNIAARHGIKPIVNNNQGGSYVYISQKDVDDLTGKS